MCINGHASVSLAVLIDAHACYCLRKWLTCVCMHDMCGIHVYSPNMCFFVATRSHCSEHKPLYMYNCVYLIAWRPTRNNINPPIVLSLIQEAIVYLFVRLAAFKSWWYGATACLMGLPMSLLALLATILNEATALALHHIHWWNLCKLWNKKHAMTASIKMLASG